MSDTSSPVKKEKNFLPLIIALLAVAAGAFWFFGRDTGPRLYLYTWDTYAAPELFAKFEQETGIKVFTDIYSSNDTLLAKLKSGASYDLVAPSGNYIPMMIEDGLLQPLPDALSVLHDGLAETIRNPLYDPQYKYALPLFYGTTAIAVNTQLLTEDITSWKQFFARPEGEAPSIGMLDDTSTVMALASIAIGRKNCDTMPDAHQQLQKLLQEQKAFVKVYGATGYFERLAANEVALQMAWSGDVYNARLENPAIKYVYPAEGVELWMDSFAIPTAAKNVDSAVKFIEFAMRPENAAAYAVVSGNIPTVAEAMEHLPQDMKDAPEFNIPKNVKAVVSGACPQEVAQTYSRIWENLLR